MEHQYSEYSGQIITPGDLAALIESSEDAIFTSGVSDAVVLWSRGAERIYGYTRDDIIGKPVSTLIQPQCLAEMTAILERVKRGERFERWETDCLSESDRAIRLTLKLTPLWDGDGNVRGTMWVSAAGTSYPDSLSIVKRVDADPESRALVMETANRVALDVLAHRTGVEALRHIADAARTLSGAQYAAIGVARLSGDGLSEFVTVGMTEAQEGKIGHRPQGIGVLGFLLKQTAPLRIDVLKDHLASAGFPPNHPPMQSFLGVPIRRGETVIGSLYLTNKQGREAFTEADEVAVQALGAHAAVAIHNLYMLSQQQALVRGLIHAQEEERRAVAYDLHDGLTQYVMASHAHFETFRRAHGEGNSEKAERELKLGMKYLQEAVVESRRMINGLRSLALDDLGLAGALEQMLAEEKGRAGWFDADLIHNIEGRRFDNTLETAIYRVAQESITNARKHSESKRVRLLLLLTDDGSSDMPQLMLEVRDWGKGFNPQQQIDGYEHLGLQSIMERVRLLNGTYKLESTVGEGTAIKATFPALGPDSDPTMKGRR